MYQFSQETPRFAKFVSAIALGVAGLCILPIGLVAQQEEQDKQTGGTVNQQSSGATVESGNTNQPKSVSQDSRGVGLVVGSLGDDDSNHQAAKDKMAGMGNAIVDQTIATESSDDQSDISISVSQGGKDESLKIQWNDGRAQVTYSTAIKGEKTTKQYDLTDIADLEQKNRAAFRFYNQHVNTSNRQDSQRNVGSTSTGVRPRSNRASRRRSPRTEEYLRTGQSPRPNSQSNQSSSSAWQTSSMTNNNGVINRTQDSGTTGNGVVGGGTNGNMTEVFQQMMDKTDDPEMKRQIQKMMDQFGGK